MQPLTHTHTYTGVVKILEAFLLNLLLTFSSSNLHVHQSVVRVRRGKLHANTACDFRCNTATGPATAERQWSRLEIRAHKSIFCFQKILPMWDLLEKWESCTILSEYNCLRQTLVGKLFTGGGDILDAAFLFSLYNQMSTVHWGNENEMSQADLAFLLLRLDYFGQYSAKVSWFNGILMNATNEV